MFKTRCEKTTLAQCDSHNTVQILPLKLKPKISKQESAKLADSPTFMSRYYLLYFVISKHTNFQDNSLYIGSHLSYVVWIYTKDRYILSYLTTKTKPIRYIFFYNCCIIVFFQRATKLKPIFCIKNYFQRFKNNSKIKLATRRT